MDCQSFDASLLDLLYDEEELETGRALESHAAGCSTCGAKLAKLRRTRELYLPALVLAPPATLEARILAAAEEAEGRRAAPAVPAPEPPAGAKVFRLFARPELAIAATFVLVAGAAFVVQSASKSEAPAVSQAAAPMASATSAAEPAATTTPGEALATASAVALATPPPMPASKVGEARGGGGAADVAASAELRAAKALYDSGRYAEALPKLDAIAASEPAAALYAARCVAKTKGCAAAAARYDRIAEDRAGTEPGSRAALEIARCFKDAGQIATARSRYGTLTTDNYVASEASSDLAALDTPRAAARPVARPAAPAATPAKK